MFLSLITNFFNMQFSLTFHPQDTFEADLPFLQHCQHIEHYIIMPLFSYQHHNLRGPSRELGSILSLSIHFCFAVVHSLSLVYLSSVRSPQLWNSLPNQLRKIESPPELKCSLKTHLFRKDFDCASQIRKQCHFRLISSITYILYLPILIISKSFYLFYQLSYLIQFFN